MKSKGFTLIELLIVIAIIGILSAVGMISFSSANAKGRDSRRLADVQQLRSALELYRSDCGNYPETNTMENLLATDRNFICGTGSKNFINSYMGGKAISDPKAGNPAYQYSSDGDGYTITIDTENILQGESDTTVTYTNP